MPMFNSACSYLFLKWCRGRSRIFNSGQAPFTNTDFVGIRYQSRVIQLLTVYMPNWTELYKGSMSLYLAALEQNILNGSNGGLNFDDPADEQEHVAMCVMIEAIEHMATGYEREEGLNHEIALLNNEKSVLVKKLNERDKDRAIINEIGYEQINRGMNNFSPTGRNISLKEVEDARRVLQELNEEQKRKEKEKNKRLWSI